MGSRRETSIYISLQYLYIINFLVTPATFIYFFLKEKKLVHFLNSNGPYIECIGGGRKVFAGAMKYFRQIFIDHEIVLKNFDEPQKIFLCASLLFFLYIYIYIFF